jgi:hypothetical protein
MFTVEGILVTTKLAVARGAHVLGIVLSVHMGALGNSHHVRLLNVVSTSRAALRDFLGSFLFDCGFFSFSRLRDFDLWNGDRLLLLSFFDKLLLNEILE